MPRAIPFITKRIIAIDKDGNYIQTIIEGNLLVPRSIAFEKLNSLTGVEEPVIINGFTLFQNYPNPFNPSTTIEFQVNIDSFVILNVFNILGEKVAELVNRQLDSGKYKVNFYASDLHSGIYFYKLSIDGGNITKRMILIK